MKAASSQEAEVEWVSVTRMALTEIAVGQDWQQNQVADARDETHTENEECSLEID